jgi:hypothetical protein
MLIQYSHQSSARRVVSENFLSLPAQRLRQLLNVVRDKVVLVVQNERLEQPINFSTRSRLRSVFTSGVSSSGSGDITAESTS